MIFQPRSVVARADSPFTYRVVWVEPGQTWIMSLDPKSQAWPEQIPIPEIDLYNEVPQEPTAPLGRHALKKAQQHFDKLGPV